MTIQYVGLAEQMKGDRQHDVTILRNFNWQIFSLCSALGPIMCALKTQLVVRTPKKCIRIFSSASATPYSPTQSTIKKPRQKIIFTRVHYYHFSANLFTILTIHFPSSWRSYIYRIFGKQFRQCKLFVLIFLSVRCCWGVFFLLFHSNCRFSHFFAATFHTFSAIWE